MPGLFTALFTIPMTPEMKFQILTRRKALGFASDAQYTRACIAAGMGIVGVYKDMYVMAPMPMTPMEMEEA